MSYSFDIIGVTPVLNFFYYQQDVEQNPRRSKAYLGSYECTLDAFIKSTEMIPQKPNWNWDKVVDSMVEFWFNNSDGIQKWKNELEMLGNDNLIVARIANVIWLRHEFEDLIH